MLSEPLHATAPHDAARPWLDHYQPFVPPQLEYPKRPVSWLLERAACEFPQQIACCYYEEKWTYQQLHESAIRIAGMLGRLGMEKGDRVGLLLPNMPEFLAAAYGTWIAGGVVVALSPLMVGEEIARIVADTDCRIVLALDVLAPLAFGAATTMQRMVLVTLRDRLPRWQQLGYALVCRKRLHARRRPAALRFSWLADELTIRGHAADSVPPTHTDPAFILPTGGTTDRPRSVVLTHANLVANAWQLLHWVDNRGPGDSVLAVAPFFHSYGLTTCATTSVAAGATMILYHRFKAAAVLKLIRRYRPTCFPAVPSMLHALNQIAPRRSPNVPLVGYCISGGAPLDPGLGAQFSERFGATVVQGYGLSEASPVTHSGPLDGTAIDGTIGLPLPDTDARIVDVNTGQALECGEVGELLVRGPQVMQGYWRDPQGTSRVLQDGWLHTGDLATCDAQGFFRIVDRKKDLIITSGINVYPTEVEHVLRRFPGVIDAAVVGVPDEKRGELVKAILVVEKTSRFDRRALDRFAEQHLARPKRPRIVEVQSEDLPRNFLGKVLRRELRPGAAGVESSNPQSRPSQILSLPTAHRR